MEKLKEIWEKFLEFGIEYTIDKENLLLNIKWDIKGNTFYDCYKLGIFQYVGRIDGNLHVQGFRGHKNFTFENLKCINWDFIIGAPDYVPYAWWAVNCEAEKLCLVNGNLEINGSLKAPLKKISWNCNVSWSLPSNNLEYIWGNLYLYKNTAPAGSTEWWIYFPVLRYVGGVELNGYNMGSNKSIEIGDNKVYWDVIYFIDPYDPRLKEKVDVICNYLSREYNRGLYDSIPTNEDYKTYIKTIPVDRDSYRDDD